MDDLYSSSCFLKGGGPDPLVSACDILLRRTSVRNITRAVQQPAARRTKGRMN